MGSQTFVRQIHIPAPAADVFRWHTRPGALERLTPPWEKVEVLEQAGGIENGSRVMLGVHLGPVCLRWVAEHRDVKAGHEFRDVQISGPFARWEHTHRVKPDGPQACYLEDRITYALPFDALSRMLAGTPVRRKLDRLFAYRHTITHHDIMTHMAYGQSQPLHILVTGSTGLVGSALVPFLTTGGHRVTRLVRSTPQAGADAIPWDVLTGRLAPAYHAALTGIDAVVHLAAEPMASGRWSARKKAAIRDSRVQGTRLLCERLAQLDTPPDVLVCASATGYYGNCGDEVLTEASAPGTDFLSDVCRDWEAATAPARQRGIRVVHLRLGMILSMAGGALARMRLPFRLGAGGVMGDGRQYVSWIALDDVIGAIHHVLCTPPLHGPVNVVAPQPVTQRVLTRTLGHVRRRPIPLPRPAAAVRLVFGEMAETLWLASRLVEPTRLLESGYTFRFPTLDSALRHLLGKM